MLWFTGEVDAVIVFFLGFAAVGEGVVIILEFTECDGLCELSEEIFVGYGELSLL
jgi:hypothetical protein